MEVQSLKYTLSITGASAASPCVLTTSADHGLETGKVDISGFSSGEYALLNGKAQTITRISDTTFSVAKSTSGNDPFSANGVEAALVHDLDNTFDAAIAVAPDLFRLIRPSMNTLAHKAQIIIEAAATAATGITDVQVSVYTRAHSGMVWFLAKAFTFADFTETGILGGGTQDVAYYKDALSLLPQVKVVGVAVGSGTNSYKFAFVQGQRSP